MRLKVLLGNCTRPKANWYLTVKITPTWSNRTETPSIPPPQSTAVEDFCNWLKHEVSIRVGHDTERAKVVLCGHRYVSYFFGYEPVWIRT